MLRIRTPIAIALALAAPLAGWVAMGPALQDQTGSINRSIAGGADGSATATPPQAAILTASQGAFEAGLAALDQNEAVKAIIARDNLMPRDGIERHALTYAIVTSGLPGITSEEYLAALQILSGWPGMDRVQALYERALYREHPSDDAIFAAFKEREPLTPEGHILLARGFKDLGEKDKADRIIRRLWTSQALNTWLEDEILRDFASSLSAADHRARMDFLLYRDRIKQAGRFAPMAKAEPLFDAWSAVIRRNNNARALLKAAAAGFKGDPALLYANIVYLQYREDYDGAAKLLASIPKDAGARVNSDEWWHEQRIVSRGLFENGKVKEAYELAAAQVAETPRMIADAEFHAGWFALIGLKDGKLAASHFSKLLAVATGPASTARAYYWLGRAERAAKTGDGQDYFRHAARYSHTFYGLVAATQLAPGSQVGAQQDPQSCDPTPSDRRRLAASEPMRAIALFEKSGFNDPARRLYRGLASSMEEPGDLAMLALRARDQQDQAITLEIGKKAYAMGACDANLAYPIGIIPQEAQLSGVQLALAYAVSRQESGFNPLAVSPARAKGLMQLLPGTARDMAAQLGLDYAPEKLTQDTAYNAILGTQYLDNQIKRHDGSYILTFAAYNAGPGKVREWVSRFGDPRGKSLEVVLDWIESIPYPETREYVMHVMENFEAYQSRLGLKSDIAADLTAGG